MKGMTMKSGCFHKEQLMAYSTRLLEPAEDAEIRRHLTTCAACRAVADQYGAVDSLLEEWKPAEPSPWFDARLRAAVARADAAKASHGGLFGLAWTVRTGWSAPVLMAALVAVSVVIIKVRKPLHPGVATSSHVTVAVSPGSPATPPGATPGAIGHPDEGQSGGQSGEVTEGVAGTGSPEQNTAETGGSALEAHAAQVARDDDMLANFDVLSELPAQPDGAELTN